MRRRGGLGDVLVADDEGGGAVEGEGGGEKLVVEDADGVDVAGLVGVSLELLGGHVVEGAHHHARGHGDALVERHEAGDAEVGELDARVSDGVVDAGDFDEHVAGLDVAVDQIDFAVGVSDGIGDGLDDDALLGERQDALRAQQVVEVHTLHILHEVEGVLLVVAEHLDDVGVLEVGDEAGLVEETLEELGVLAVLGAELLGHVDGAERDVADAPQLAHAADGQPIQELVVPDPADGFVFFHGHVPSRCDAPL